MKIIVEFSIHPIGAGESVGEYVARCVALIDQRGLDYRVTPMGTIIQGEWDAVFSAIQGCFDLLHQECNRLSASIRIDSRQGRKGSMMDKVESVRQKVGSRLRTA